MEYFTTTSSASRRAVDCVIIGIYARGKLGAAAADLDAASNGRIKRLVKSGDLSGELGRCTVLNDLGGVRAPRVAVVGLGKSGSFGVKQFRTALAAGLRAISYSKCRQLLVCLTLENVSSASPYYVARHTAECVATFYTALRK